MLLIRNRSKKSCRCSEISNKIGIISYGTFTLGHLGETKEQMDETIEYAKNIGLHSYQAAGVGVLDGSPLGKLIKDRKMQLDENDIIIESDADTKSSMLGYDISHKNN